MNEITTTNTNTTAIAAAVQIGKQFDKAASATIFNDYVSSKAHNTRKRHVKELKHFSAFLESCGIHADMTRPEDWKPITFGIIEGYQKYLLRQGYAISTINQTIFILKAYSRLAMKAGYVDADQSARIDTVKGFGPSEGKHLDEQRPVTRIGAKKAENTRLNAADEARLKNQPDTLQGRRDRLLMTILLDHGARISEVAALTGENFNMKEGLITFYRQKTNRTDTHRMTKDTAAAATAYLERFSMKPEKSIWIGTRTGHPDEPYRGFKYDAMKKRIAVIGEAAGIKRLSPHDCRHYFASKLKRQGYDAIDIMRAGGWTTLGMVNRYVDQEAISYDGREKRRKL